MKFVRGSMRHLYRLEGIGDEDYSEEAKKITKAENGALVGETAAYWAIIDEDVDGSQHVFFCVFTDHTLAHPLNCRGGVVARLSA